MLENTIKEIFNWIKKENAKDSLGSIPHSDTFAKQIMAAMGVPESELKKIIDILKESHKILVFEISKEDPLHNLKKTEAFVEADLMTIARLKNFFQKKLMEEYENKYSKRLNVHQIIKEIFPNIRMLNNTPLGYIANKAIMLEEYENLLEKEYQYYSETWKDNRLQELTVENREFFTETKKKGPGGDNDTIIKEKQTDPSKRRAIDSDEYSNFAARQSKESIKKLLQIYGVDFFFRVHLRKYDFDIIIAAIEIKEIDRKSDLRLLKEMIKKIKLNFERDPELEKHEDKLYKLERAISRHMLSSS
jgi:hypothetical protein